MRIRSAVPDDAPAVVALRAVVYPYLVRGVESTRRMIAEPPPGEDWVPFVAEVDGQVVGWASAYRSITTSEPDFGEISLLHVHPEHRRRGAGDALFGAARQHLGRLGVRRVRAWALADSLDFARRHGFAPTREARYSALTLDPPPPGQSAPDGVRLVPLADLDDRRLYEAYVVASADEPDDVPADAISYETWRYEVWDHVALDKVASTAAVVDSEVVAFSLVKRDGERLWSDMTATMPHHRGRGLARLVKVAALRRAAERGATVAYTSNAESNAPMLAINARLGYRPVGTQFSCLATLA
ncbi:GNAT family N-acetyltransferase [Plantactinospora soyae]|uniref:GNAT superfamily N-acetyltransferase n=1 Tax=Plantactinospora soyae TaxID=1544732 RepID=A0A927MIZ3_9ACTN|nr:GNAT family N-acetyltransferase [Plantactinospora soyae]MBE1492458.1 GNAT superfamily N-acetyltransferase [Plantactinospora soyae]